MRHAPQRAFVFLPAVLLAALRTAVGTRHKALVFGDLQLVAVHAEEEMEVAAPGGDFDGAFQPKVGIGPNAASGAHDGEPAVGAIQGGFPARFGQVTAEGGQFVFVEKHEWPAGEGGCAQAVGN